MTTRLSIDQLRRDGGTQPRAQIDSATVREYAEDMTEGAEFPPVVVFYDGADYWLADGFHRVNAAASLGWLEVDADVRQGTRRDAVLYSVSANAAHGMRRTNADKRRAVETLLRDEEWSGWSDNAIAQRVCVSPTTVGTIRRSLSNLESDSTERTYTTKHGTVATMNTAGIGKREEAEEAAPESSTAPVTPQSTQIFRPTPPTSREVTPMDERLACWLIHISAMVDGILTVHQDLTAKEAFQRALTVSFAEGEFTFPAS